MTSAPPSPAADAVAGTLTRLRTAVLAHDEAAFTAATLDRDGFGSTVAMIWSNLAALAPTTFDWSTTGLTGSLPAARADRLGPGAQLVQTEVSWAVAGDPTPARQLIWLTLVPDPTGALLVAATTDRPPSNSEVLPAPLWLLEPLRVVTRARCTVLGGLSTDLTTWAAALDRAAVAVAARVPAGLRPHWTERLVAELPSNETLVERVLGAAPGARAGLAAITWPESTDQASAPLRIVVNPAATNGLPTLGLDVLATHEATHVATRSPLSPAPLWLVEGFADWVAYDRWPAAARPALDPLLDAVLAGRGPTRLPSDADFDAGAPDLDLRYAEAWTACRYVAASAGPAALTRLYAAAQPPGTEIAEVVRRVLGRSPSEVVRGWRTDLEREARARAGAR